MARILVVDDEQRILWFLARALQREGFDTAVATNGPDGLRMARTGDYAIVILDLMLPGIDGMEVLRRLKEHLPEQRVLVLSAVGDVGSKVRCLQMGAVDYIPKPFALAELVARIQTRLREPATPVQPRWLQVGDVALDTQRRTLEIDGESVALSHREYVLLSHLMRRAGEVCSREELLAEVWGYGFDPGSNVVDVYVRRVRAKLRRGLIETVRNVGYSFVAG